MTRAQWWCRRRSNPNWSCSRRKSATSISRNSASATPGRASLIREAYGLLGLRTYLTTGEKETRAWTIHAGDKAPQAAGVIHSDFEKSFISAETVSYRDLTEAGSFARARELGKLRTEGKEYVVQDGDVIEFKTYV